MERILRIGTNRTFEALQQLLTFMPGVVRGNTDKAISLLFDENYRKSCGYSGYDTPGVKGEFVEQKKHSGYPWHEEQFSFGFYAPKYGTCENSANVKIVYRAHSGKTFALFYCSQCFERELKQILDSTKHELDSALEDNWRW